MKSTALIAALVAALGILSASVNVPAEAKPKFWDNGQGFDGNQGFGRGYGPGGRFGRGGWQHNLSNGAGANAGFGGCGSGGGNQSGWGGGDRFNSGYNYQNTASGFSPNGFSPSGLGFGQGGNSLVQRNAQITNEIQQIQLRLNAGNLSPRRTSSLRDRLSSLKSEQTDLNNMFNSRINDQQSRIQQLLDSGNLNPKQASFLEDRLAQLQDTQNAMGPNNSGFLAGVRNWLSGY